MAIIKTKETTLSKKKRTYGLQMLLFILLCFGSFILSFMFKRLVGVVTGFIFFIFFGIAAGKHQILYYGVKGEKRVLKALKRLDDQYTIFNDITIKFESHTAQIDHLVIGPTGVFTIETKNMIGKIKGNADDKEWKQIKRRFSRNFYSPYKQSKGHAFKLKEYFKTVELGNVYIQPTVVFARNFTTRLKLSGDMPVFKVRDIRKYIEEYNQKGQLSSELQTKIILAIENNISKSCENTHSN